jgi:hydroxyacylglutathione hydrolase
MPFNETKENSVIAIPALGDNYIYLCKCGDNQVFAVDPGDASPVWQTLEHRHLNLVSILVTHHHYDHTAGAEELKKKTGCNVIAANKAATIHIGSLNIQPILTPGHTQDSVCYYVQPYEKRAGLLFTGDTLFIGGCGRPMECEAKTLWHSLQTIAALPDDTLIYPGHDYTEENYEFALTIEPDNTSVKQRIEEIRQAKKRGLSTVPSAISQEKITNVFLRAYDPQTKTALNMTNVTDSEVFAELRRRKNIFG